MNVEDIVPDSSCVAPLALADCWGSGHHRSGFLSFDSLIWINISDSQFTGLYKSSVCGDIVHVCVNQNTQFSEYSYIPN